VTGATFLDQMATNTHYDVRTGAVTATTPEPTSWLLAGFGVLVLGLLSRR
jgi:MYXO-CTERM domain-containing protein